MYRSINGEGASIILQLQIKFVQQIQNEDAFVEKMENGNDGYAILIFFSCKSNLYSIYKFEDAFEERWKMAMMAYAPIVFFSCKSNLYSRYKFGDVFEEKDGKNCNKGKSCF